VVQLRVVRELMENDPQADWFDFSPGTGIHKKRFGNVTRTERSYVLFPRSTGNLLLAKAYVATEALSQRAVRFSREAAAEVDDQAADAQNFGRADTELASSSLFTGGTL
jgi:hypothetical protein